MDEQLAEQLKAAEEAVVQAEKEYGPNHPELAEKLQRYATLLRKTEKRALDAVNVEARARAIRAKMYAEAEAAHGTSQAQRPVAQKKSAQQVQIERLASLGMYAGFIGMFIALGSLFINQAYLIVLIVLSIIFGIADVVLSRAGFWRIAITVVFCCAAFWSNKSVPDYMLANESPMERFSYASENHEVVEIAKSLGPTISVLSYQLNLPQGFKQVSDESADWGRAITWQSENLTNNATKPPRMMFILVKLTPEILKNKGRPSILKAARDVAMPQLATMLQLEQVDEQPPRFIEVNGINFAKIVFTAKEASNNVNGFAYVAVQDRTLIMVAAVDEFINADSVINQMDASLYTLKKRTHAGAL